MSVEFDPNSPASQESGIFGLPYIAEESKLVIIPVPWEATVSYGGGTSRGPELVLEASRQVDLFDIETKRAYQAGYYLDEISAEILSINEKAKAAAQSVIATGDSSLPEVKKNIAIVNELSAHVNNWLKKRTQYWYEQNKIVAVLGGDHSSPLGLIEYLGEKFHGNFGVLHMDAHADLRNAYEGFQHSHASIMFNVMNGPHKPSKLVQVGIRDFCEEEFNLIESRSDIETYFDVNLQNKINDGKSWRSICEEIVSQLPKNVYVSFDIDGLDPSLCPDTGTPVPGGLTFSQATTLIKTLVDQQKKIIGFDLNEVSGGQTGNEWNGNIGARLLYKLCGWTVVSNGLYKP